MDKRIQRQRRAPPIRVRPRILAVLEAAGQPLETSQIVR
jgi:hypothetical protein